MHTKYFLKFKWVGITANQIWTAPVCPEETHLYSTVISGKKHAARRRHDRRNLPTVRSSSAHCSLETFCWVATWPSDGLEGLTLLSAAYPRFEMMKGCSNDNWWWQHCNGKGERRRTEDVKHEKLRGCSESSSNSNGLQFPPLFVNTQIRV
jgi:hypothetical protein